MPTITDTFPGPALDPDKWTAETTGSVSYDVGTPEDGVWPIDVDDDGDEVRVHSQDKIIILTGQDFDVKIFYDGVYTDAEQSILATLGWRSDAESGGDPVYGVDVLLRSAPGATYTFQKRIINSGSITRDNILEDPQEGADGGFRIAREGLDYLLYRWDPDIDDWSLLDTITLPSAGSGYVTFSLEALDPVVEFPWILQT